MITFVYVALALGVMSLQHNSLQAPDDAVRIRIAFPNRVHHEAQVEMRFPGLVSSPLEVRMSRASPGRYRLHDFARNVYSLRASDGQGRDLEAVRVDPHGWRIDGHDGDVTVRYTVYGDLISGTYSSIDETHAKLNPPSVFLWSPGLEDRPVELRIERPEDTWRAITQLESTDDPDVFRAPDLQYFFDSPIEVSDFSLHEWRSEGPDGRSQGFRFAFHHLGTAEEERSYVEQTKRIVLETAAVFGEYPDFDYGVYTFTADYLPWGHGDAMEHRNSTPLSSQYSLAEAAEDHLETLVHEFIHAWNVERLRPASLEPFDFDRINMSAELWFAEGFTNYYDGLLLARSGAWSKERFLADTGRTIDRLLRSPAPTYGSPRDMAQHAAFRDRAAWRDPQNAHNTYLHYYFYGDAVGLALDLMLRSEWETDLDAVMRRLWVRFGRSETPYAESDLEAALAEETDADFARDFFDRYVRGSEKPDFASLVERFGLRLEPAYPDRVWIGDATLGFDGEGATITSGTTVGSPLYEAGLDRGDRILRIDTGRADSRPIATSADFDAALGRLRPGDRRTVRVQTRAGERTVVLAFRPHPELRLVERNASDADLSRLRSWLASKVR